MDLRARVSVCIPVYGVEKYIEKCARTLFEQTLQDIEYIFVDDCTPDRSIEILQKVLEEYPHRKNQVKVIRHEINQGVGAARNHAVAACTGEYVIHCDPDDWVELDMYETMYNKAKETDADMVYCAYRVESPDTSRGNNIRFFSTGSEYRKAIGDESASPSLWDKMFRASIALQNDCFPPDNICFAEDWLRVLLMCAKCNKTVGIPCAFYHYRWLLTGLSKTRNKEARLKSLKSRISSSLFCEQFNLLENTALDKAKYNTLFYALKIGCGQKHYNTIFPEFQRNITKTSLSTIRKSILLLAKRNYNIAHGLVIFAIKLKNVI